jgi:coenzyme F420-reducing hydrogenase gamma subunit
LVELLSAFLAGRKPNVPRHSVCFECKTKGNICVMVAGGEMCLGPVTQAGCGAICPSYNRGCYSCFGPKESPNTSSLSYWLDKHGKEKGELLRAFRQFNAYAEAFRKESESHEK